MALEMRTVDNRVGSLRDLQVVFEVGALLQDKSPETQELIGEVYSLHERCNQKLEKINANNIELLDQRHEDAVLRCRDAQTAFDSTQVYGASFDEDTRRLTTQLSNARQRYLELQSRPPNPSTSLKSDYRQYEEKLASAQRDIDAVLAETQQHELALSEWRTQREKRLATLRTAQQEEADLRYRLNAAKGVKQTQRADQTTGLPLGA